MNVLGRLLMELREQLRASNSDVLKHVEPPSIPNFLLLGQRIGPIRLGDVPSTSVAVSRSAERKQAGSPSPSSNAHGASDARVAGAATEKTTSQGLASTGGAGIDDDASWLNGPPYAVEEVVFDENELLGCFRTEADLLGDGEDE